MRKLISVVFTIAVCCFMFCCTIIAAVKTSTIAIYPMQAYNYLSDTRTGNYSYVQAGCNSIYPTTTGVSDTYTKIQVRVVNSSHTNWMSDVTTIRENNGMYNISLYEGTLSTTSIQFGFRNTNNSQAGAVVKYDAK